jgi:hypothetical protein
MSKKSTYTLENMTGYQVTKYFDEEVDLEDIACRATEATGISWRVVK